MKLAVFDLDGTLAKTNAVDEICFLQAFADAADLHDLNDNWLEYEHATDSGIAHEIFIKRLGREPTATEISKIIERFVELLREHHVINADQFIQIPGANSLLLNLQNNSQWCIAIATGCWSPSAQFKIEAAGLPIKDFPAAFSEDGPSREAIVQAAIRRAADWYQQNEFERVVSVGDAVWDIRTAHRLALPFLGIGEDRCAKLLHEYGASHVIPDFLSEAQCIRSLDEATIPNWLGM